MPTGTYQDHHLELFKGDLLQDLQDGGMRLNGIFPTDTGAGQIVNVDKLGKLSAPEIHAVRGAPKTYEPASFERRIITFQMLNKDYLVDDLDSLDLVGSGADAIRAAMVSSLGRQHDKIILDAIRGNATVITNGSSATTSSIATVAKDSHAFSSSSATNDISLTPSKLKEARKKIGAAFGDINNLVVIGDINQFELLLTFDEVKNNLYRSTQIMDKNTFGALNGYLNMTFVQLEQVADISLESNHTPVFVVDRRAVHVRVRRPLNVEMLKDTTLQGNPDTLSATMDMGATRMYEELVVQISCHTSTHIPA